LSAHPARFVPGVLLSAGFHARHLGWPLAAAVLASILLMHGGGDRWLADALFHLEGGRWALRDHWLTSGLIHNGGRIASALAWLAVLGLYLRALRRHDQASLRQPLLYLLVAVALGASTVSLLKSITHVDCPWDLVDYGGARMPLGLFARLPAGVRPGACYPAGHASAGYAWVSLYFAALLWRPRWRWHGLAIGLSAGLLFGIGQQLRGAHFLSHDVATLTVCWLLSLGLFHLFAAHRARATRSANGA
jgi:membrane-associated PAP2 superfamily phosphatase